MNDYYPVTTKYEAAEILAYVATKNGIGITNIGQQFGDVYIEKKDRQKYYRDNSEKIMKGETDYLTSQESKTYNSNTNIISGSMLQKNNHTIWNMYIRVSITDYNFFGELMKYDIMFDQNKRTTISSISMSVNLFIAKLLGHEIIEGNDYLDLPCVIPEIMFGNNKNGFLLERYNDIQIHVFNSETRRNMKVEQIKYDYNEQKVEGFMLEPICEINIHQQEKIVDNKIAIKTLTQVTSLLFFEFSHMEPNEPILESIILLINGYPMTFSVYEGNIINHEFFGRNVYCISLSPMYRTEDDLINIFTHQRKMLSNIGINFSRIDNVKFEFKFDRDYKNINTVTLSSINYNIYNSSEEENLFYYAK